MKVEEIISTRKEYKLSFAPNQNSLRDIIEACGHGFRSIYLHHNKTTKPNHIAKYGEGMKWQAKPNQHVSKVPSQWGQTPEEAVYKLWLKLSKVAR